jgi:hypothetical protein
MALGLPVGGALDVPIIRSWHQSQWRQEARISQHRKCGPLLINHAIARSPWHWSKHIRHNTVATCQGTYLARITIDNHFCPYLLVMSFTGACADAGDQSTLTFRAVLFGDSDGRGRV